MKNKFKEIINNIEFIVIIAIIIVFNIIIGANEKNAPILVMTIFLAINIILLCTKKFFFKEKILIKSKVDIAVLVFMLTLTLPLVFRTYCTLDGTIEFLEKYFLIYSVYLLVRNVIDTEKKINIVIITTIVSSLIIWILGIDLQHEQKLNWIIKALNLSYTENYRFISTFGYANTAAIYAFFCVFLALNRMENSKAVFAKVLYCLYILLCLYIIYISYSRTILVLLIIVLTGYFIVKIYNKIKNNKLNVIILASSFIGITIIIVMYILIAMNYSKPFEVSGEFKFRKEFLPNTTYKLCFEIEMEQECEKCQLQILEINKFFAEKKLCNINMNKNKSTYEIEITPTDNVLYLKGKIINENNYKIIINKCYINNEEYILSYKYLPNVISRLITTFSIKDYSIVQRLEFYKTSIKIVQNSLILGRGGDAWKTLSRAYGNYPYSVKETHSYFFELLISYGIVGVISFLTLVLLLYIFFIKNINKNNKISKRLITVAIGLGVLLLHSICFDFHMSFSLIVLIVFVYMGILQIGIHEKINEKEKGKIDSFLEYIVIFILIALQVLLIFESIAIHIIKDELIKETIYPYKAIYQYNYISKNDDLEAKQKIEKTKQLLLREPYYNQTKVYEIYWETICNNLENMSNKEIEEDIEFGIERYNKIEIDNKWYIISIIYRANVLKNTIEKLNEISENNVFIQEKIEELKLVFLKDYEKTIVNIEDLNKKGISNSKNEVYKKVYSDMLNEIMKNKK